MSGRGGRGEGDRGQAAAELALVLPVVVLILLLVVQVGLVVRDEVLVVHAAREAVRAASVGDATDLVRRAGERAGPLVASRLHIAVEREGGADGAPEVVVDVRYRSVTDLPLVGALLPDVDLHARAAMRGE